VPRLAINEQPHSSYLLKSSILHSSDLLCASKVLCSRISAFLPLARIVHQVLGHFSETAALFAEVNHDATTASLCRLDAFFNGMRQIRPARADITPKDVTSVALIVDPTGQFNIFVRYRVRIAPDVNRQAADGREKYLNVGSGDWARDRESKRERMRMCPSKKSDSIDSTFAQSLAVKVKAN
jgi:hypothetical protein